VSRSTRSGVVEDNTEVWRVHINGGRIPTELEAFLGPSGRGARGGRDSPHEHGADGTQGGYDIAMTRAVAEAVTIPVIASGGLRIARGTWSRC